MVTATLLRERQESTAAPAPSVAVNGNVRSITGRIAPSSTNFGAVG
jgi:hypothetical protein